MVTMYILAYKAKIKSIESILNNVTALDLESSCSIVWELVRGVIRIVRSLVFNFVNNITKTSLFVKLIFILKR